MFYRLSLAVTCILLALFSAGCGSSAPKLQAPAIQITSPTTSPVIDQGQSVNVTAQVADGSAVTWSLQPAFGTPLGTPIGTLSNETNTSATYTACSGAGCLSTQQLTIVATAGNNTAPLAVTVNALPAVTTKTAFSACPPSGQALQGAMSTGQFYDTFANKQAFFTVTGGTAPYSWSITTGSAPAGLSLVTENPPSTVTAAFSGTPITPGCSLSGLTLQVTDATGATAMSTPAYLVIAPPPLKLISPSYSNGILGVSYNPTTFQVKGGSPPYTWCTFPTSPLPIGLQTSPPTSNSANGLLCSSPQMSPNLVLDGATSNVSGNQNGASFSPSFTVTDSEVPYPAAGTLNLSMIPLPPASCDPTASSAPVAYLQPGIPYAFLLRGFDGNGPVVIEGSFTTQIANSNGQYQGTVTGGEEDIIRSGGSQSVTILSGSYSNTNTHGCLTLTNSAGTTTSFKFDLSGCPLGTGQLNCSSNTQPTDSSVVCGQSNSTPVTYYGCLPAGRIIEFDDGNGTGTVATGFLRASDSSAFSTGPSGTYAFGLSGWDSSGGRYAAAGSFSATSSALSSVAADINDAGAVQSSLSGGSGTFSSVDANGRATASLSVGSATLNLVAYVVSSGEIMLSTTGAPSASNPVVSGEALGTTGPFSTASLENQHMFRLSGYGSGGPDVSIGFFSFDGIGDITGTIYEDQAGTLSTTSASGNYTVDADTGRVLFSAPQQGQTLGTHTFVAYVIPPPATLTQASCAKPASCITGFLVGTTDATAQAGVLEFQTPSSAPPPPFGVTSVVGYYALAPDELPSPMSPATEGFFDAIPSSGTIQLTEDVSFGNANYCNYGTLSQTCNLLVNSDALNPSAYSVNSNGTGTVGGETVSVTNGNVVFYINESPLNLYPSVVVAEQ